MVRSKGKQKRIQSVIVLLIMLGLLVPSGSATKANPSSEGTWQLCAVRLLEQSGKLGPEHRDLPKLYQKFSVDKSDEFMQYLMAVIYTESRFNKNAVSSMAAYGLMQMTQAAAEVAQRTCNLRALLNMESLHESSTNIRYGSCYLKQMLNEVDGDWDRALILYNGGYKQLTRYDKGDTLVSETANYVVKINKLVKECRNAH